MSMYPTVTKNPAGTEFWQQFSDFTTGIESKIPTLDKSLDAYFDRNFALIIEEWDLLTDSDLRQMEGRLASVTSDISALCTEKIILEKRIERLDDLVASLERSI